ncbi:1-phosphofructokinase family hexose kinase [Bacillus sp. FJAT-42376]|uniref:1-phosphofructokinase family hexose kinase n=1 Tax=Bacillus sp. FJAT-42376 TaxID=2014076 RepID=UPI000F4F17E7|nr:1-phosphofructokinase family hexose kinase [Bacillus sp. FJAT-42376]AZB43747.1 1-phosphofructokinase family hexose kinase [Bacillus sp. FJAT-42376]
MITSVTLNAAADFTYIVPDFRKNETNRVEKVFKEPGGKGINAAKVLHTLGIPVTAAGFAGGENGRFIIDSLTKQAIPTHFTEIGEESRACHAIADSECKTPGLHTELLEKGPSVSQEEWGRFLRMDLPDLAAKSDYVLFSGSLPSGLTEEAYADAAQAAAEKGPKIILDTGGRALEFGIQAKPFLIKPNLNELEELLGKRFDLNRLSELASDLKLICNRGPQAIAVTLGSRGSILYQNGTALYAEAPVVRAVNPTGSGDAFLAGMTAALYRGSGWEEALKSGTAAGAANAMEWTAGKIKVENYTFLQSVVKVYKID